MNSLTHQKTTLGNKLSELRKAHNYSQEYLSKVVGMSQSKYSRIESGINDITIIEFGRLVDLYKLNLTQIITEINKRESYENIRN